MGGGDGLTGNFILAERFQVEDDEWWEENGGNVGLIVQCVNQRTFYHYPPAATSQSRVRVDPRYEDGRQRQLDKAMPHIAAALEAGLDVVIHCNQSFHRCPVTLAAVFRRLTGCSAAVCICVYFLLLFYISMIIIIIIIAIIINNKHHNFHNYCHTSNFIIIFIIAIICKAFLDYLATVRRIWRGHMSRCGGNARANDDGMVSAQGWAAEQTMDVRAPRAATSQPSQSSGSQPPAASQRAVDAPAATSQHAPTATSQSSPQVPAAAVPSAHTHRHKHTHTTHTQTHTVSSPKTCRVRRHGPTT